MPDPSPGSPPSKLARLAQGAITSGMVVFGSWQLFILYQLRGGEALPESHLNSIVVTTAVMMILCGLIYFGFWRQARRHAELRALFVDTNLHHARALARLNQTLVDELAHRSEIPTDRIVAVVNQRLSESDRDRDLLAAALASQVQSLSVRLDEFGGPPAEVIQLPSAETREAFRRISERINAWPSGDTRGDIRGGRNYRE